MPLGCDVARSVLPLRLGNLLRDALKEVLCFVFVTLVVCVYGKRNLHDTHRTSSIKKCRQVVSSMAAGLCWEAVVTY